MHGNSVIARDYPEHLVSQADPAVPLHEPAGHAIAERVYRAVAPRLGAHVLCREFALVVAASPLRTGCPCRRYAGASCAPSRGTASWSLPGVAGNLWWAGRNGCLPSTRRRRRPGWSLGACIYAGPCGAGFLRWRGLRSELLLNHALSRGARTAVRSGGAMAGAAERSTQGRCMCCGRYGRTPDQAVSRLLLRQPEVRDSAFTRE